ncbi:MAG: hypothetical protein L6R40_000582 [Gallowayella cf. fulva]|nr:MAG: hypothetical protein L6R40_000582 [Xanthomendoza cf. fulva]
MRSACFVAALAGLAYAAPKPLPQSMNFEEIESADEPIATGPAPEAVSEPVTYSEQAAKADAIAEVTEDLSSPTKRSLIARDVNDPCAPQPNGDGPKPAVDTDAAFLAFQTFHDTANKAPTPQGYQLSFADKQASVQAKTYMGLYTLDTYDTIKCQQLCDAANSCAGFNIYFERDPQVKPAEACPKPSSFTNIKCTLFGSGVTPESATNKGQYRQQFHVVIAGSNGYTKNNPPDAQGGFTGPTPFGGAINAPDSFMTQKYFPGVYDAGKCAGACQTNTAYNKRHPRADGTYDACNFYNVYLLSKNNVPQGTYCGLYTKPWDRKYSTNFGQQRGTDYYSVSSSYGYTLAPQDAGHV